MTGTHALVESSFGRWPRRPPRPRPRPKRIFFCYINLIQIFFCYLLSPRPRPRPSPPSPRKPPVRPIIIKINLYNQSFSSTNLLHHLGHLHVLKFKKKKISLIVTKSFYLPPRVPKPPRVPPRSAIFDLLLNIYLQKKNDNPKSTDQGKNNRFVLKKIFSHNSSNDSWLLRIEWITSHIWLKIKKI